MNGFHRLHALRMENDQVGFEMDEMRPRFEQLAARKENGTAKRAVSAYQLFQTPPELAGHMVDLIGAPGRLLEPSAGLGRLITAAKEVGFSDITAVEVAPQCAAELFTLDVRLLQRDFLTVDPAESELFDCVLMNPPFHMRADITHIQHALRFLKRGGQLVALCLDTYHREQVLKPLASTWEKIPAGTFRKEGTNVATVLLSIVKAA